MECCLGTTFSIGSVVMRDSTVQGVMPGSPEAWKGHNSLNTCPNGANKEFIGIY